MISKIKKLINIKEDFCLLTRRRFNDVYASDSFIIKISKSDIYDWQKNRFSRERLFFDYIKEYFENVKVPDVLLVDESKLHIDNNFSVMNRIKGVHLYNIDRRSIEYDNILKDMGETIAKLHSIKPPFEYYGLLNSEDNFRFWHEYISRNMQIYIPKLKRNSKLKDIIINAEDKINELIHTLDHSRLLLHNDLHIGNFLINADTLQLEGLIDGELACIGDPMYDIGRFNLYNTDEYNFNMFMEGYSFQSEIEEKKVNFYTIVTAIENLYFFSDDPNRLEAFKNKIQESLNKI